MANNRLWTCCPGRKPIGYLLIQKEEKDKENRERNKTVFVVACNTKMRNTWSPPHSQELGHCHYPHCLYVTWLTRLGRKQTAICRLVQNSLDGIVEVPYSSKRWRWKTLANPTENYKKCIPHK